MKKLGIVIVAFAIFLLAGCGGPDYKKLEKDFVSAASKNYESDIRGKVLGVGSHDISLQALENAKVDTKEFTDAKCDKTSYVRIIETLDKDGKPVGAYKTEAHLTCGTYKSTTTVK